MYEVDSGSFEVMDSHTWYSNVTAYPALDRQVEVGPTYVLSFQIAWITNLICSFLATSTNTQLGKPTVKT